MGWTSEWRAYPQAIVAALGPAVPDARLINYLRTAQVVASYRGLSRCRFECGISDQEMGYRDLSDGVWIWPEGLAHYVEKHELPLAQEFLDTVAKNSGQPPAVDVTDETPMDRGFWNVWFSNVTTKHG